MASRRPATGSRSGGDRDRDHGGNNQGSSQQTKKSLINKYFIVGEGINREVLQSKVGTFLGPDAYSRPAEEGGVRGFHIYAIRPFTSEMMIDIKEESANYEREQASRRSRGWQQESYDPSRSSAGPPQNERYPPPGSGSYQTGQPQFQDNGRYTQEYLGPSGGYPSNTGYDAQQYNQPPHGYPARPDQASYNQRPEQGSYNTRPDQSYNSRQNMPEYGRGPEGGGYVNTTGMPYGYNTGPGYTNQGPGTTGGPAREGYNAPYPGNFNLQSPPFDSGPHGHPPGSHGRGGPPYPSNSRPAEFDYSMGGVSPSDPYGQTPSSGRAGSQEHSRPSGQAGRGSSRHEGYVQPRGRR